MNGIRGLHGYTAARGMGAVVMPRLPRRRSVMMRRRGMGQDGSDGGSVDLGVQQTIQGDTSGSLPPMGPPPLANTPTAVVNVPVQSNSAVTNFLASEAGALTKIFGQTVAPQTTIQTPQGLLITGPSGAISSTSIPLLGTSLSGSSLSSLLLVGGAVLVGIFAIKAVSGK